MSEDDKAPDNSVPTDICPDVSADVRADITPDGTVWRSYDELAQAIGIKRDSVIRLVHRKRWPRREGNTPRDVRVAVPADILADMQGRRPDKPDLKADITPDVRADVMADKVPDKPDESGAINALSAHIETLREQLAKATVAVEHERRGRELDRQVAVEREAAAAQREAWLRDQLETERVRLMAQIEALTTKTVLEPVSRSRFGKLLRWLDKN